MAAPGIRICRSIGMRLVASISPWKTVDEIPLNESVLVTLEGLHDRPLLRQASPRGVLHPLGSEAAMGGGD